MLPSPLLSYSPADPVSGVVVSTLLLLLLLMLMLLPVWQYLSMCNLRSMITWNCWTNGGVVLLINHWTLPNKDVESPSLPILFALRMHKDCYTTWCGLLSSACQQMSIGLLFGRDG